MDIKTKLEKRLRKAISALFSVSRWGVLVEHDEERRTYFFRLRSRRGFLRKRRNLDELILVSNGGMVGVSLLDGPEESDTVNKLKGADQEWEPLFFGYAIGNLANPNPLPGVAHRINLGRDEFYEVVGQASGEFTDYTSKLSHIFGQSPPSKPEIKGPGGSYSQRFVSYTPGEAVATQDIYGKDNSDGSDTHLHMCRIRGLHQTGGGPHRGPYMAGLGIEKAEKTKAATEVVSLQEWFLNGPRSYVYPRYTARTTEGPIKKDLPRKRIRYQG